MFCASSCTIRTHSGLRIQLTCKEVHCRVSTANNVQKHPRGEQLREIVYVHRTEYYTAKKITVAKHIECPRNGKAEPTPAYAPQSPRKHFSKMTDDFYFFCLLS